MPGNVGPQFSLMKLADVGLAIDVDLHEKIVVAAGGKIEFRGDLSRFVEFVGKHRRFRPGWHCKLEQKPVSWAEGPDFFEEEGPAARFLTDPMVSTAWR